jgi:UDP-N-acetyl-2-amino-2-deoxyglucuronate dehydrogenase
MADRVGMAIIGCGMAALPHGRALRDLSHQIEVRGVYARNQKNREVFAAEFGFPTADSAEALAADPDVDAVLLITPPNAREDYVRLFSSRGKHILTEKPLERTLNNAERIVSICADANVHLGVVFQHRFREASQTLSEMIREGVLGTIRVVSIDVPWWRDQSYYDEPGRGTYARDGGGVLISQAIHTLDLMVSLCGPVKSVQALSSTTAFHQMEAEDFVAGGMVFENGAVGSLSTTTAQYPGGAESIRLDCDLASVVLKSGVLHVHWRNGTQEAFGTSASTGGGADPMAFPFEWHRDLIADFARTVSEGRPPAVSGAAALEVHRLIAALEQSSSNGVRVDL